jgi:hypothetical protein
VRALDRALSSATEGLLLRFEPATGRAPHAPSGHEAVHDAVAVVAVFEQERERPPPLPFRGE